MLQLTHSLKKENNYYNDVKNKKLKKIVHM